MPPKATHLVPGKWPEQLETALFHAMLNHRVAGVHKHMNMAMVYMQLVRLEPSLTVKDIWDHLATMYDLDELDELEDGSWVAALEAMGKKAPKFT
ncbi:hypothetical protein PTSG_08588 [Salpingoeca rosetta]|uniref:Uncharacterized protein n=1 Tax=Salpingoeca rosetta (strain ATCC 50818 / BSB-021) TaxID=946362 RepID=F2UK42_SALR5|nr:uncharacterized protein PTSG_08588 [Salpingoeca rosetta]EGD77491.1 hypothetical protein PTSG_08588 [Salpingoeca rosetta]|eukprot:XP_004990379.1 hypothetical protein PTSG_08588 [Salpingoeca rosetta]